MMQWNYGNTSRNFRRIVEAVGSRLEAMQTNYANIRGLIGELS